MVVGNVRVLRHRIVTARTTYQGRLDAPEAYDRSQRARDQLGRELGKGSLTK